MSFLMKDTGIPLYRILVLEPYDITWLGIQKMMQATMGNHISLRRIHEANKLVETALSYQADSVLINASGHRDNVLPLLQQLSMMCLRKNRFHISVYLRNELPHLEDLLLAFGVDTVFRGVIEPASLVNYFKKNEKAYHSVRLTPQERNVAQALLAGQSVTRVAQLMQKDIRTISTHKKALLRKLNMVNQGELQVLGGSLMSGVGMA